MALPRGAIAWSMIVTFSAHNHSLLFGPKQRKSPKFNETSKNIFLQLFYSISLKILLKY